MASELSPMLRCGPIGLRHEGEREPLTRQFHRCGDVGFGWKALHWRSTIAGQLSQRLGERRFRTGGVSRCLQNRQCR